MINIIKLVFKISQKSIFIDDRIHRKKSIKNLFFRGHKIQG